MATVPHLLYIAGSPLWASSRSPGQLLLNSDTFSSTNDLDNEV